MFWLVSSLNPSKNFSHSSLEQVKKNFFFKWTPRFKICKPTVGVEVSCGPVWACLGWGRPRRDCLCGVFIHSIPSCWLPIVLFIMGVRHRQIKSSRQWPSWGWGCWYFEFLGKLWLTWLSAVNSKRARRSTAIKVCSRGSAVTFLLALAWSIIQNLSRPQDLDVWSSEKESNRGVFWVHRH